MPYVITTRNTDPRQRMAVEPNGRWTDVTSRRAVATLDEAREAARETIYRQEMSGRANDPQFVKVAREFHRIDDEGGTVGPLPDGTVIEVEWVTLAAMAGSPVANYNPAHTAEIIDAFNAAQEN